MSDRGIRHAFIVEAREGGEWTPVTVCLCSVAKLEGIVESFRDINRDVADDTRYRRLSSVANVMLYVEMGVPVRGKMDGEPLVW